jgi:hypothetical protein
MKRNGIIAALGVVVAAACGPSTNLVRTWREPSYAGRDVKRVLVIGLTPNQHNRKVFEYAVAAKLQDMKYEPVTGIDVLPKDRMADHDAIVAAVKERGVDIVLVSRLVSIQTETEYVPPAAYAPPTASHAMYPYYSGGYATVYSPGYVTERQVVYLETNAYDAQKEQLVWSGVSKTFDYSSIEGVSESVAKKIVQALRDQGVI